MLVSYPLRCLALPSCVLGWVSKFLDGIASEISSTLVLSDIMCVQESSLEAMAIYSP
jgi:hypothetical protein